MEHLKYTWTTFEVNNMVDCTQREKDLAYNSFFIGAVTYSRLLMDFKKAGNIDALADLLKELDRFLEKQGIKVEKHDIEDHGKKH